MFRKNRFTHTQWVSNSHGTSVEEKENHFFEQSGRRYVYHIAKPSLVVL